MKKSVARIKIIVVICCLLVAGLVGYQIYNYFFLSIRTEYAIAASMEDTFAVSGLICRNEIPLAKADSGYYDIVREDGDRVSRGGTIAEVYSDENDVKVREEIRLLKEQVEEYNAAITAKSSFDGDSTLYENNIQDSLSSLSGFLQAGNVQNALDSLSDFQKNVYIKEIVNGSVNDYQEKISEFKQKIAVLEASVGTQASNVVCQHSGYYSRVADGFEDALQLDALKEYDLEKFNKLFMDIKNSDTVTDNLGKVVVDYTWQYYFVTEQSKLSNYRVGDAIYLRFDSVSDEKVKASIITMKEQGDNVFVGVECSAVSSDFLSARLLDASVIVKSYSGIRVDKNSIRIIKGENGEENGVYVKVGSIIRFKKVKVLYMGSTYALVEKEVNGSLENFDEVVVSGKNLYDKKLVS